MANDKSIDLGDLVGQAGPLSCAWKDLRGQKGPL